MSSTLDDFFGEEDRRVELGNKLVRSLEQRLDFDDTRFTLLTGQTENMTEEERQWYSEWLPLEQERVASIREPHNDRELSRDLPDFDRDTSVNGVE